MKELLQRTHTGRYLLATRAPVYQLILLLPLLVGYEVAAVLINFDAPFQIRNGADILVKGVLRNVGIHSTSMFVLVAVLFVSLLIVAALRRFEGRLRAGYFAFLLAESALYAVGVGVGAGLLTRLVVRSLPLLASGAAAAPEGTLGERLMIGLGAGVYEELVFRALLIGALYGVFRWVSADEVRCSVAAIVTSALLFSAFHYIGDYGDVLRFSTFVFRFMAGLILSGVFVLRGIGVTAWSHALYDVFIVFGLL